MALSKTATARTMWAIRWLPATRLGRIACWFALGFLGWFFVANPVIMMANQPEGLPIAEPLRTVAIALSLAGFASGLVGAVVALVAIVRSRERAIAVFAALAPGVFVVAFLLGELLLPH